MIVALVRVVDRSGAYYERAASDRARDPLDWQRRFDKGRAIQARLRAPRVRGVVLAMRKAAR